jgi:hypothetical protein
MKEALVLFMLAMLTLPMLWGIWRLRRLPRDIAARQERETK